MGTASPKMSQGEKCNIIFNNIEIGWQFYQINNFIGLIFEINMASAIKHTILWHSYVKSNILYPTLLYEALMLSPILFIY